MADEDADAAGKDPARAGGRRTAADRARVATGKDHDGLFRSRRLSWWSTGLLGGLVAALVGLAMYLFLVECAREYTLQDWVERQGYTFVVPAQSRLLPGDVVRLDPVGHQLAYRSEDLLGDPSQHGMFRESASADVVLNDSIDAGLQAGVLLPVAATNAKIAGASEFTLSLHDLQIVAAPTVSLQRRVNDNADLQALGSEAKQFLVVTEVLRPGRFEYRFHGKGETDLTATVKRNVVAATRATGETGGGAAANASAVISSSTPMVIGYKLAALNAVAGTLGGGQRLLELDRLSFEAVQARRNLPPATRLATEYDIHALIVAQGNYPDSPGSRAGGVLPGVRASAEIVRSALAGIGNIPRDNIVQLLSPGFDGESFTEEERLTRDDLLQAVRRFASRVETSRAAGRQTLVLFYYFGHGLADDVSRTVFLVPEAFDDVDSGTRPVELASSFVALPEVIRMLGGAADDLLLLIDACRAGDANADQRVAAASWFVNRSDNLSDVAAALREASGIYGPAVVLFGSPVATSARTVPYRTAAGIRAIGPLAARLDRLVRTARRQQDHMTIADFIGEMQRPVTVDRAAPAVRGYTALRADRRDALPRIALLAPARGQASIPAPTGGAR